MLLRLSDYLCVRDKLFDGVLTSKLASLLHGLSHEQRMQAHWDSKAAAAATKRVRLFSEIPQVQRRIERQYGGKDVVTWIYDTYLRDKVGLRAVSVGCGTGNAELQLAELARDSDTFSQIIGFDPSPGSVKLANDRATNRGVSNILRFVSGTIERPPQQLIESKVDVAFAFSSLHHIQDLNNRVAEIRGWLKPGGVLIAHEYIGPRRQQYSRSEIALIISLFRALPEKYRRDWHTGKVRTGVPIPGALLMWLYDPSEMVEADNIEPAIRKHFSCVEHRAELGTLLLCLLKEIGHNFPADDFEASKTIDTLCDIELSLIDGGLLSPHFATIVARA
jgi:SAM-dependent methyltransferase